MRKFLKLKLLLLILTLSSLGCEKVAEKGDEDSNARFFDVVYQVESTRQNKNFNWIPVQGIMYIQILQSSDTEGTFKIRYQNYKEPQFATSVCVGVGVDGNVTVTNNGNNETGNTDVYNPSNPYNTGSVTSTTVDLTDPDDPNKTISPIKQYQFLLKVDQNRKVLDAGCRNETDRTIVAYRFANGQVVMVNEYRELKLNPVLVNIN